MPRTLRTSRLSIGNSFVAIALALAFFFMFDSKLNAASLTNWNAGRIIDDAVFTDTSTMSATGIQSFLNSKVPVCDTNGTQTSEYGGGTRAQWGQTNYSQSTFTCLKDYSEGGKTAAQIIFDTSQKYQINPQVLLVLLQKEQGLVTDTWPLNLQYRIATGYGCPDTAPCDTQYYGLTNQVDWSAKMFRAIMNADPAWYTPYSVGNNTIYFNPGPFNNSANAYYGRFGTSPDIQYCGSAVVNIQNRATAALYNYTPYQPNASALSSGYGPGDICGTYGNRNFYLYFTDWFGSTELNIKTSTVFISDGTYTLTSPSNRALDVTGGNTNNGTKVQIWDSNGTGAQQWEITNTGDGYYRLKNVSSGKYLDVTNAGISNGTSIQIWEDSGSCAQKWAITSSGGFSNLLSACSGKALDISGGAITVRGTTTQIWTPNNTDAQKWKLSLVKALVQDDEYYLTTQGSQVLDIAWGGTQNGSKVQIWDSNGTGAQKWSLRKSGDGYYEIINPQSGRSLDVAGAGTQNGSKVQIWDSNGTGAQKWSLRKSGSGYLIISSISGKLLDVSGGTFSAGTSVQIWDSNGTGAQQWSLKTTSTYEDGTYTLTSPSNRALDVTGGNTNNGTKVQIWDSNGTGAQQWEITNTGDGYYRLKNVSSGKYLDVTNAGISNGTSIQIWEDSGSCAQKWAITSSGGFSNLLSACSGKALDISGGAITVRGTTTQIWTPNNTDAQKWKLSLVKA